MAENDDAIMELSLDPSSAEYSRWRDARRGQSLDEHERKRLNDLRVISEHVRDTDEDDEWHSEYQDDVEMTIDDVEVIRLDEDSAHLTPGERRVQSEIVKDSFADDVMRGVERAEPVVPKGAEASTRSERRLPKVIESEVRDPGVTLEDFFPGSRTLNRYM